ncbi:MAG: RNA polymerase sigma factor [Myxococcales bacterium]|nr:RNA polymerase sigma factor [Myxococcales bacterium]
MGRLIPLRRISGDSADLSDEALLAACATGDRTALGGLFDRFHLAVYRFVSRLPAIDEMARDDVVQATFLELPRTAAQFQGHSSVKTWILGVASNVARHQMRSEQRRRVNQDQFAAGPSVVPEQPDAEVDRHRLLLRIADVLQTLPHDQQLALVLCDIEQLPGVEVARMFEIPEGTLWRRLHMARKALRAALAKRPG